ncbi:MAG TPA: hypothetical protein VHZ55_34810 [Bryobacteraceae bacterium]|nr:hypothetical protein [Bryobacteraceae bacterium]
MALNAILIEYQARVVALHAAASQLRLGQIIALAIMSATIVTLVVLAYFSVIRRTVFLPYVLLPLPVAIYSGTLGKRRNSALLQTLRLKTYYQSGVDRLEGKWPGSGVSGREFVLSGHCYDKDLQVFGEGSLFELLCTCRTQVGRRQLAKYLVETPTLLETVRRQEAVRELQNRNDLREQINLLGEFSFQESTWGTITEWLESPVVQAHTLLRALAFGTSVALALLLLLGFDSVLPWSSLAIWIGGLLLLSGGLGLHYRARVLASLEGIRSAGAEVGVLREGLSLIQKQKFSSALLTEIVECSREADAPILIRKLERLMRALTERDREWFYIFSRVLLIGTQVFLAVERWRAEYGSAAQRWLHAWGEFEALTALANYAYEHPDNRFARFSSETHMFEGQGIGHPLLPAKLCVRNDISLNEHARLYVISGSNMAGKSTLLRAIGLNAVLAYAGAPVCADSLVLSRFSICASLAIQDSLLNGQSKFFAEVDRIRQALDIPLEQGPVLFLIDELFGGTNSKDRRVAAEAILRAFIERGAMGAVSTHDLALTELAAVSDLKAVNVHMGSGNDSDPMNFDYRVKPGVANQSSALAIIRLAGVPV